MAHLDSKHSKFIFLNNDRPTTASSETITRAAIQGNTNVTFVLSNIQTTMNNSSATNPSVDTGETGFKGFLFDSGVIGEPKIFYQAKFNEQGSYQLPVTTLEHTYYSTVSSLSSLSAQFSIFYNQSANQVVAAGQSPIQPLTAVHKIELRMTPDNIVDRNLELLNGQMFTVEGTPVPSFNIETDENIIYPVTYYELLTSERTFRGIYLNTDPETQVEYASDAFLFSTEFFMGSALSAFGTEALSGAGFTILGNSGRRYIFEFFIPQIYGENAYSSTLNSETSSTSLSNFATILIPDYLPIGELIGGGTTHGTASNLATYNTVLTAITAAIDNLGIVGAGKEFTSIRAFNIGATSSTSLSSGFELIHSNLLPPDATIFNFNTSTSAADISGTGKAWFKLSPPGVIDNFYTYPVSGYGLSATNRITTDPLGNNITAI